MALDKRPPHLSVLFRLQRDNFLSQLSLILCYEFTFSVVDLDFYSSYLYYITLHDIKVI